MSQRPLQVFTVTGSMNASSVTRVVISHLAGKLANTGCLVDTLDLAETHLPLFNPETSHQSPAYPALRERVAAADVLLLGTPDYHGSISGVLKNFLDHFWQEFTGKLFATVVASHEKGLTVTDQLRTIARQCYAWSMPYGVSFEDKVDVKDGQVVSDALKHRLAMFERDIRIYGRVLAAQRQADLAGSDPGFMARLRKR